MKGNKGISENLLNISSSSRRLGWILHVLAWGIMLIFPFLFFSWRNSESINWFDYLRFFLMISGVIVVFYADYLYLIRRFLFKRERKWFLFSNFLLFTVLIIITHLLMDQIPEPAGRSSGPRGEPSWEHYIMFIFFDYLRYSLVATVSVAFKMTSSWYKTEAERKELEQSRSEAELQNLKSQLNPHFLFNTLNNIYSLIAISPERAQEAVHDLSRLLRYVLYESSEAYVTVGKDLDFVRNYVELMRIRMPEHAQLTTKIETTAPQALIAPLLFITLIENAFKHGVSNNKASFICIELDADSKHITCNIRNSYFPKDNHDKSGSGIGLANLERRLKLLYSGKYIFSNKQEGDSYYSHLEIDLD